MSLTENFHLNHLILSIGIQPIQTRWKKVIGLKYMRLIGHILRKLDGRFPPCILSIESLITAHRPFHIDPQHNSWNGVELI